ncbi:MAG: hypothetical protein KIT57_21225 [Blastocatellales bacterium]|nr:hypothetical protein [Blastocatellales bacterium]
MSGCLRRRSKDGGTQYSHVVVGATLVRSGSHAVLPLDVEEVRNEDGGTNRIARSMPAREWRSDCAKSIGN